ncbi:extracellular solute-binding protein [Cryobacterium sp. PH31-L1]|uniref:extracellular solute-binding protein n=1 Tax=Cryobacterium sp. PH31-L1 TaxID=3046199 RepID=UPI0024BA5AE2|nr:extracellular solute-binding protein [Cryobacterium sp. PH31-L1]MDJ0376996.1 extracellular solute-binding protein [Cryobacterium sp. PH31-L1]
MSRKISTAIGLALTGSVLLAGCSAGSTAANANEDLTVWFMREDVPQVAQDWLVNEWADTHDGATLTIEIQDWDGIVTKLQTTLASPSQTPDLVEFGNSQVITFSAAGALSDITDMTDELGGSDLIPSLVEAGTHDGALYAAPFFAGSRIVYYRKSLFQAAGIAVPTTIAEVAQAAITLQQANPEGVDNFSGIFLPAKDFGAAQGWVYTHGSTFAELDGDTWKGTLSTPEGIAALEDLQNIYLNGVADAATATLDEARQPAVRYSAGQAGMFVALNNAYAKIDPALLEDTGVFALPGVEAGSTGKAFAGGSNIAIPAQSPKQDLAREALALTLSETFQSYFASDGGWVPGNISYAAPLEATEVGQVEVQAVAASVMTPAAEGWATVEGNDVIRDLLTQLAQGGDVKQLAADTDAMIESLLN